MSKSKEKVQEVTPGTIYDSIAIGGVYYSVETVITKHTKGFVMDEKIDQQVLINPCISEQHAEHLLKAYRL